MTARRRAHQHRPARSKHRSAPAASPRFSLTYLDRSADPLTSFYDFATGAWRASHPIPPDKADWNAFWELRERNARLLHAIAEEARRQPGRSPAHRLVGTFYRAELDTRRRNRLGYAPIARDLASIARTRTLTDLLQRLAELHSSGVTGLFEMSAYPDRRKSDRYALYAWQGGLALPDREYYLSPSFARIRERYRIHVRRNFGLAGWSTQEARAAAATVVGIETELARASRTRVEERDVVANYHRLERRELLERFARIPWTAYFEARDIEGTEYLVVGQPEFLEKAETLLAERPIEDLQTYLTWHLLHASARHLTTEAGKEHFEFFRRALLGQQKPEPAWRRALYDVDELVGEALGALFVARHFPPSSRTRMAELVEDLRQVFTDRLRSLDWMTEATRKKALAKFARFEARIGHPDRFRDYTGLELSTTDHLENVRRANVFESRRRLARIGGPVDREEWFMTPPTVNAYFNATQNEIFFPAGILQPPFFDPDADDAVNYGAIGAVIGHEITHGYDDQGRRFDEDGNLRDWWSDDDAREFAKRAQQVVLQYSAAEPLPGLHVNGELTLGENIADFGGVRLALEALHRKLARDPPSRRTVGTLTPEQRFFLSYAQIWRQNCREEEIRRRVTVDPHAPGRFRAEIPLRNLDAFRDAFAPLSKGPAGPLPPASSVTIW
jgi:putative endopeptidase